MEKIKANFNYFAVGEEAKSIQALYSGRINETYTVTCANNSRFLFQKINSNVFGDIPALMQNLLKVVSCLEDKYGQKSSLFQVPVLVKTRAGELLHEDDDKGLWRCFHFMEGCQSFDLCTDPVIAKEAGLLLGRFHSALLNLDPLELVDTIPKFHFFPGRISHLQEAIDADPMNNALTAQNEIDYIFQRESSYSVIASELSAGRIPLRSVHNDVKLNNFLFSLGNAPHGVSLVDLDTCMAGSALYDFGELIKFIAMPAGEEEPDMLKLELNLTHIEATIAGYAEYAKAFLIQREIELLHLSPGLFALMLGTRFLTDHLEGDKYFKVDFEGQNLQRCRLQLQLHAKLEHIEGALVELISQEFRS